MNPVSYRLFHTAECVCNLFLIFSLFHSRHKFGLILYNNNIKVKLSLCLSNYHAIVCLTKHHGFLASALGGSDQLHAPAALLPGKEPPHTHWVGGWVGPAVGLDAATAKRKILSLPLPRIEHRSSSL